MAGYGEEDNEKGQDDYWEEEHRYGESFADERFLPHMHEIEIAGQTECVGVLYSMRRFLDKLFRNPPADMRGDLLNAQREAWREIRGRVDSIAVELFELPEEAFESAALVGRSGAAKIKQWVSARFDFSDLNNSRRAARVLHVGTNIAGSMAGLVGATESVKEAFEAAKYVADLAVDETGR